MVLIMKIFNDEKTVIYDGQLDFNTLDFDNMEGNASFLIPINDDNLKQHIEYTAWKSIQGEWCGSDDDKLKMLLYIDLLDSEFKANFQFIAFPYLPPEKDIKDEMEHAHDDEGKQAMKDYYELVKDYYKTENNGCGLGEYATLDMKLTNEEKMDLMYELIQELVFTNSRVKTIKTDKKHDISHAA
jgi:hypothetical protein